MFSYWKSFQIFSGKRQSRNKSFMYIVWLNNAYLSSGTSKHLYGISHQFPFSKSLINMLFSMHINKALLVKKFLLGLKQPNLSLFVFFPSQCLLPHFQQAAYSQNIICGTYGTIQNFHMNYTSKFSSTPSIQNLVTGPSERFLFSGRGQHGPREEN